MKLNIFVSSTCYDLSQIRSDIRDFISEIGHNPILSEEHTFPIDPNRNAVENCIETVRNYADLFILIMGNRYGSQINGDKSITNSEFLAALEKNIPIYTFTLKQMVHILPIWKKNPNADYSNVVDSNKIFEFVDDVRNQHKLWNFEFEKAKDITEVVKSQLSILFKTSLIESKKLKETDTFFINNLSAKALKLIIEKKDYYEQLFFLQTFEDEISKYSSLKNDYTFSLKFASEYRIFSLDSFLEWIQVKYEIMQNYIASLNSLINSAFKFYYGEPGIASDLKGLYYVSNKIGIIYRDILSWSIELNSLIVDNELLELKEVDAKLPEKIIEELENFPLREKNKLYDAFERVKRGEKGIEVKSVIDLQISDEFSANHEIAINQLRKRRGL